MPGLMLNSEVRQRTYSDGLRGPADWVERETADLIRALFASRDWRSTGDLDRLWSVNREAVRAMGLSGDLLAVADQVFLLYGFPELEPSTRARVISERAMQNPRSLPQEGVAGASNNPPGTQQPENHDARPEGPQAVTYGFSPRID